MATYTQGVNVPSFQPFIFEQPLDVLFSSARRRQAEFDTGLRQVGQEHQQMQGLSTTSQFATEKKNAYMQEVDEKLRKISTADFSLSENVNQASSLYKPLTSDRDILTDIAAGRKIEKEIAFGEKLRTSTDEKDRASHWSTMDRWIQINHEKLRMAQSPEDLKRAAQDVSSLKYVPYFNIAGYLNTEIKDKGFKYEVDSAGNGYIRSTTGGQAQIQPLYLWAQANLPEAAQDVFRIMGKVQAHSEIQLRTSKGMTEQDARRSLAQESIATSKSHLKEEMDMTDRYLEDKETGLRVQFDKILKRDGGYTEQNFAELNRIKDGIEAAEGKIKSINRRMTDLDQPNTLESYAQYPDQIYADVARTNMIRNWSTATALNNFSSKLSEDKTFFSAWDARIAEMNAQVEYYKALASLNDGKKSSAKEAEEGKSILGQDRPRFSDINPSTTDIKPISVLDYFNQNKKIVLSDVSTEITNLFSDTFRKEIEDTEKRMGLGNTDFNGLLTYLSDQVKKGATQEGIIGVTGYAVPEKYRPALKVLQHMPGFKGKIDVFSDLFDTLQSAVTSRVQTMTRSASKEEQAAVKGYQARLEGLRNGASVLDRIDEDEKKIKEQILRDPSKEFSDIISGTRAMSLPEYVAKKESGKTFNVMTDRGLTPMSFDQVQQYMTQRQAKPSDIRILTSQGGMTANGFAPPTYTTVQGLIDKHSSKYEKMADKINERMGAFLDTSNFSSIAITKTPEGKLAFQYPYLEYDFKTNDKNISETAENIIKEAFVPGKFAKVEEVVSNVNELATGVSVSDVRSTLQKMEGLIGDMTDKDGRLFISKVGKDGQNPIVNFRPSGSSDWFKSLTTKDSTAFSDAEKQVLNNMLQYGVTINAPNSAVQSAKGPSLSEIQIEKNGGKLELVSHLKDEGFYAQVIRKPNNGGYEMVINYKTIDPNTGAVITQPSMVQPLSGIEGTNLDSAIELISSSVLDYYFRFKNTEAANRKQASKPLSGGEKTFNELRAKLKQNGQ